jgi:hypothetical protein
MIESGGRLTRGGFVEGALEATGLTGPGTSFLIGAGADDDGWTVALDAAAEAGAGSGFFGTKPVKSRDSSSLPEATVGLWGTADLTGGAGIDGVAPVVLPEAGLTSGFFDGGGLFLPNSEKTTRYFQL